MNRLLMISAFVVVLTACSDDAAEEKPPEAAVPVDTAAIRLDANLDAPGGVPVSKDTSIPPGTVGSMSASMNVLVEMNETSAKVSHPEIAPGQVTIVMENKGTQPHSMEIKHPTGGRWRTMQAAQNSQSSVTMVLG